MESQAKGGIERVESSFSLQHVSLWLEIRASMGIPTWARRYTI